LLASRSGNFFPWGWPLGQRLFAQPRIGFIRGK
jgi:hypothetical protein